MRGVARDEGRALMTEHVVDANLPSCVEAIWGPPYFEAPVPITLAIWGVPGVPISLALWGPP